MFAVCDREGGGGGTVGGGGGGGGTYRRLFLLYDAILGLLAGAVFAVCDREALCGVFAVLRIQAMRSLQVSMLRALQ